jgi:hypothetical protein
MSQALNRLRAMVSLPKYSPPMPRPRRATSDGWTPVDQAESQVLGRLLSELTQEARFAVTAYREM